ncbi:MAG: class I SAM-dependent methyltransferase [Anaerolineae bacterium]|nr:class I SAM-dependent methyltransferase [Anaerolineae bacterium]
MTLSLDRQNAYRAQYRARHPNWRPATEVYESLIRQRLKPGMRVIDVGCGRGGVLEQLGDRVARPVGLDPDWLSLREHRLPHLPRAAAFADALPLRDSCADLIVCSWVLEHLAEPGRVFTEIRRVLAPGGCFVFLTPNATSLIASINRVLRPFQQTLVPRLYGRAEADTFPVQYRANTAAQLTTLAAQADLRPALIQLIEDPTYLAFNPLLFRVSMALARVTPPVHLVGVLAKE